MKKVSIVMPTYNRGYCLGNTIQSVLNQTYRHWELLLIDNMSIDNTREVAESFKDNRIKIIQINNRGIIAASRNLGIAAATGEFIAFMDSDDPWLPKKLECSIELLGLGCDLVYHDLYLTDGINKEKNKTTRVSREFRKPVIEDLVRYGNGVNTSSVVARSEIVRRVGGFSESPDLVGIEDYDIWVRIASITDSFGFIQSPMGYYTQDGNGTLNTRLIERGLIHISKHHSEIHTRICGGTPSWIRLALAKIWLRVDPARAIESASEVIKRREKLTVHIKAVTIICLAKGVQLGKVILNKTSRKSS